MATKKGADISHSKLRVNVSSKNNDTKKVVYWIIALILFYTLTTATVSTEIAEVTKNVEQQQTVQEPYVVEKLIKTTKYREEKVPFGTPRCEQMNYNFSKTYTYNEGVVNNKKQGTCTFFVKNEEDIAGTFTFYPQFFKNGGVSEGPEITKSIEALESVRFEWNITLEQSETANCLLQIDGPPKRMKCFYLAPITYSIKQVPYTVEEKKNVTEFNTVIKNIPTTMKANETVNVYTNRFLGYTQFFYFGY